MKRAELLGKQFGRLYVFAEAEGRKPSRWWARCSCGIEKIYRCDVLIGHRTVSCGCHKAEMVGKRARTHGHRVGFKPSPTYNSWRAMLWRCEDPKFKQFRDYGGRGIKVCDTWHVFANFLRDMGERPNATTLDRIDVNSHYSVDNCRWATRRQQSMNRRCTLPEKRL